MTSPSSRRSRPSSCRPGVRARALLLAALAMPPLLGGCLRPTIQVTSEPSGAAVVVNGDYAGTTPVTVPFIWYWYYEMELRRDGYEELKVRERMYAPPYYYIPLDLLFEIIPVNFHDRRYRHYYLEPERLTADRPAAAATAPDQTLGDHVTDPPLPPIAD